MKLCFKAVLSIFLSLLYTVLNLSTISALSLTQKTPPDILSMRGALIDAKTGIIIYDKYMNDKVFPASTTKIMTALLTLEYADGNYDERIKFSKNAVYGIERGSSHIAMDVDETLSVGDALYAILLASANEVSMALAEHIGGSVEGFAEMMNERAKELGAKNTHFNNPHGLDDDEHYTTAYDMALIMKEAVKYDKFKEIIATKQTAVPPTEKQPEERPLNNTNQLIYSGKYSYEDVVGGKTGYTDIARHTLVSYAEKDGMELIAVLMQGEKNEPYIDSIALYDYGFLIYDDTYLLKKGEYSTEYSVRPDENNIHTLTLVPKEDVKLLLPDIIDKSKIEFLPEFKADDEIVIREGEAAGKLKINYDGAEIADIDLIIDGIKTDAITMTYTSTVDQALPDNQVSGKETGNLLNMLKSAALFIAIALLLAMTFIFAVHKYNVSRNRNRISNYRDPARLYRYRNTRD